MRLSKRCSVLKFNLKSIFIEGVILGCRRFNYLWIFLWIRISSDSLFRILQWYNITWYQSRISFRWTFSKFSMRYTFIGLSNVYIWFDNDRDCWCLMLKTGITFDLSTIVFFFNHWLLQTYLINFLIKKSVHKGFSCNRTRLKTQWKINFRVDLECIKIFWTNVFSFNQEW